MLFTSASKWYNSCNSSSCTDSVSRWQDSTFEITRLTRVAKVPPVVPVLLPCECVSSFPGVKRNLETDEELRVVLGGFDVEEIIELSTLRKSPFRMFDVSAETSSSLEIELFCFARRRAASLYLILSSCFAISFCWTFLAFSS